MAHEKSTDSNDPNFDAGLATIRFADIDRTGIDPEDPELDDDDYDDGNDDADSDDDDDDDGEPEDADL